MGGSRVMYLVTEPWYFANHRLDHARALLAAGFDVHVATRRGDRFDEIVEAGCVVHEVDLARGAGGVRSLLAEMRAVRRVVRSVRPDVVHAVALKPLAISLSLLAMRHRPALILSVNGLGVSAARRGVAVRVITSVIRFAARLPRVTLLFQTTADRRAVVGTADRGVVIPGVGVDTNRFSPDSDRAVPPPFRVVYLGRAVRSKGLPDLVDAVRLGPVPGLELDLYCAIDQLSPGSLTEAELDAIRSVPSVTLHPATRAPHDVLRAAHGAILPSRAGEGVSKFVLEALASGVPVLLAAESGSAEVLEDGVGIVFSAADPRSIRAALTELTGWTTEQFDVASRRCREIAEERFALDVIAPRIVDLHRRAAGVTP